MLATREDLTMLKGLLTVERLQKDEGEEGREEETEDEEAETEDEETDDEKEAMKTDFGERSPREKCYEQTLLY